MDYSVADEENQSDITFEHKTPSLILWKIVEGILEDVRPTYQYANEELRLLRRLLVSSFEQY